MKISADKSLGQHFLINTTVINKIVHSCINEKIDAVIEVGPGMGALTKELLKIRPDLYAIEKDPRFIEILFPLLKEHHLIYCDALKFNWQKFLTENNFKGKRLWLVSNLPYNVATPLFIQFIQIPEIHYMTLMMQKEVGEKLHYVAGKKNQMCSLLSHSQNYFETELVANVNPGSFNPPPKVDSIVFKFIRRESPLIPLDQFEHWEKFLRALFSQKRKQINHQLKNLVSDEAKRKEILATCNVSPQSRAESLNLPDIQNLYKTIY